MKPMNDLTNSRFGLLTVVKADHKDKGGDMMWECICVCGNTTVVRGYSLRSGVTRSCGCLRHNTNIEVFVPEVGQEVCFDPFSEITGFSSELNRGRNVTGTVVMVNVPHGWFSVEYGDPKQRASFKFSQFGTDVKLRK